MKMPTEDELKHGRALPSNVLVQNRPAQRVYVFGHQNKGSADGHLDEVEMKDMPSSLNRRGKSKSFEGRGPAFTRDSIGTEEELTYVLHAVESHHTLRGIALQYRVTVGDAGNCWQIIVFSFEIAFLCFSGRSSQTIQ
jgi:hypothetical protein